MEGCYTPRWVLRRGGWRSDHFFVFFFFSVQVVFRVCEIKMLRISKSFVASGASPSGHCRR